MSPLLYWSKADLEHNRWPSRTFPDQVQFEGKTKLSERLQEAGETLLFLLRPEEVVRWVFS